MEGEGWRVEGGGRIVDELGGAEEKSKQVVLRKMRAADFHERPAEKCPRAWDIHERPAFFHERPAFFYERPAEKCPRAWDFYERPAERKMIMPEIKGSSLFSFHPPPSTKYPPPFSLHLPPSTKKPLALHPTLVQVVQGFSDYALTAKTMKTKRPVCTCTRGIYGLKTYAGEMRQPYCIIRRMCCSRIWKAGATMAPWSWPSSS